MKYVCMHFTVYHSTGICKPVTGKLPGMSDDAFSGKSASASLSIGIYVFLTSILQSIYYASRNTFAVMVKLFEHIDEFHMYIMGYFSFRTCAHS
jgi:hypothetical protein